MLHYGKYNYCRIEYDCTRKCSFEMLQVSTSSYWYPKRKSSHNAHIC